ncbi:hypothetical protein TNCV_3327491 [Trichonephila clavipes]|nr:hypothetical protein TNCV_3327491 [Trichonephila clavipes]
MSRPQVVIGQVDTVKESAQVEVDMIKEATEVDLVSSKVVEVSSTQVKSILNELGKKGFGDNVETKHSLLNRQQGVTSSSHDRVRLVRVRTPFDDRLSGQMAQIAS